MIRLCKSSVTALALILCAVAAPSAVRAQSTCNTAVSPTDYCPDGDIDIFMGNSSGNADAPNIIFLIDNSPNWSRASQHWPDNGGNQGQAELAAIVSTLQKINSARPANVGVAMLTAYAGSATASAGATPGTGGGYIRFGVRDMTNSTNRTALQNILTGISNNITDPAEKVAGMANKDESAGFYEIYKYLSGLAPFSGPYGSSYAGQNGFVDVPQNNQSLSAAGEGLSSGWALQGNQYRSPITSSNPCAATYIIYIANNANNIGAIGQATYEPTVANASPALPIQPPILPGSPVDTWLDEWTYFLRTNGVVVPAGNNNGSVVTFVLDAYYAQQNTGYSSALKNAAIVGGGKYFPVKSASDISNALSTIFAEIQAVNSTFASASLPVNTTNRTQDRNQVFIPMFRPDPSDNPRWMGNLKQFQLIDLNGSIDLGDNSSPPIDAVSSLTGFLTPCAQSFWTTDSNRYWENDPSDLPAPKGLCPRSVTGFSSWSDDPDGPIVEKGGIGEVIRKGNNPSATNTSPTWTVNRTVYTLSGLTGTSLINFTSATLGSSPAQVAMANFILGHDVGNVQFTGNTHGTTTVDGIASTGGLSVGLQVASADGSVAAGTLITAIGTNSITLNAAATSSATGLSFTTGRQAEYVNNSNNLPVLPTDHVRPSVHGDEIHSRPQPVDYGATCPGQTDSSGNPLSGSTVFYGSNDGTLRAIDTCYGKELWAFVAPEFYASQTGFARLMNNSPGVSYFGQITSAMTVFPTPKDYYFDGSIGLYQNADNSKVWIYPSMRRGGRTIYAFDVTTPAAPTFKWKAGCPYPQGGDDSKCADGTGSNSSTMSGMGQTWSTPVVAASVLGYTGPVVILGGGYDTCEDGNTAAPVCGASPKGAGVYVLDAGTGALVKSFPTTRSVAADVALIAVATPGVIDHAYAVDTGGNIYRLDFAASQSNWVMNKVAYTNGGARKFLFAPALLSAPATLPTAPGGQVYLALGSGDREHPLQSEYPYPNNVLNRFYVYKDDLPQPGLPPASVTAVNLDDTTVTDTNYMYDYTYGPTGVGSTTSCSTPGVLPNSSVRGWFMSLNQYGADEQTVSSAIIAAGMVAFSTNRPIPAAQSSCSTSLGEARGYWLNLFNASGGIAANGMSCGGTRSGTFTGGGLPPSPVLANVVVGGQSMTVTLGTAQLSPPPGVSSSPIAPQQVKPTIVPTRKKLYWKSSGEN